AGVIGALSHDVPHLTRYTRRLRVQCLTAEAGTLDHKGEGHEKIQKWDHVGVSKGMLEESFDMKTDDARQAADHQCLSLPLLGLQTFTNAPGLIAIGPPYPQPASGTQQTSLCCDLDNIVV